MSETERNLETTRRAIAAFSRGDLDASAADLHPDIEWHVTFRLPDLPKLEDVYRGRDEVLELWRVFRSAWSSLAVEIEEVLHADTERIVFRARFVGRGSESGIEVNRVVFYAYRMRDGLLAYTRAWDSEREARADLGLADE